MLVKQKVLKETRGDKQMLEKAYVLCTELINKKIYIPLTCPVVNLLSK